MLCVLCVTKRARAGAHTLTHSLTHTLTHSHTQTHMWQWLWDHTEAVILDPPGAPNDDGFGEISGVDPLLAAPPPDLSDSTEMGEG